MAATWGDFWDGAHAIYAGDRHKRLHYDVVARDIARLVPSPEARVLDQGCGEALSAPVLAAACGALLLHDAAPSVEAGLRARFSGRPGIRILSAQELDALPAGDLDMVVANSFLQYVDAAGFEALARGWARLLAPGGRLVLGDLSRPGASAVGDARALLGFAARGGFLVQAVKGLVVTFFSPYRRLRRDLGLTTYEAADVAARLAAHGFADCREVPNIGHNPRRMTLVATRG